jgi:hypothetical protein
MRQPEAGWNRGLKMTQEQLKNRPTHLNNNLWQYHKEDFPMTQPKWDPSNQPTTEEIAGRMMKQELHRHIRRASEELINEHREQWLSELHLAARVILEKAIEDRDQNAMMAVWDRIVGKPTTQVDMSVSNDLTIDDLAVQLIKMNEQRLLEKTNEKAETGSSGNTGADTNGTSH